jgi:kynureninase
MIKLADISQNPNQLAPHYQHSGVAARILLTGHSHQACPDVSLQAQSDAWMWAAKHVEARWDEALERTWRVREGFGKVIGAAPERIALASSVHDLVVRFLSALPLKQRPKLITTSAEHPSVNRQLMRLAEEGVEVCLVPASPASTVVDRIRGELDETTAAVFISSVFFETGEQALELDTLWPDCEKRGVELFVDAYQSVNVMPFLLEDYMLEGAFVVGGGTKYCQLGDGIAFMHVPAECKLRPVVTGWFGTFDSLEDNPASLPISYGDDCAVFDGSSYDPTAYYRAGMVFDFFEHLQLTQDFLYEVNRHQLMLLIEQFQRFDFDPRLIRLSTDFEYFGGFVSFDTPYARDLCTMLRDVGIHTDFRKNWLRMGPAPYLCDEQIIDGVLGLEEMVKKFA